MFLEQLDRTDAHLCASLPELRYNECGKRNLGTDKMEEQGSGNCLAQIWYMTNMYVQEWLIPLAV